MTQGTRSWTDATTNNVVFRGLSTSSYLPWLLDRTINQDHLLGTFLHEFTHHWCYNSALGMASALIEMRLILLTEAHPEARHTWARDYAAYEMIRNLLRPMSEGLSQLAEFDLTHIDDDPREGTPLGAAVLCFGLAEDNLSRHMMIQGLRHSSEQLDRKASLYLKSFEVKDGYLPGYMAVKNIAWSIVGRGYNVPIETLLAYLRSYFWDDPVLVNILFSEERNGGYVAKRLHERFTQRLHALLTVKDLPKQIEAFWENWSPQIDFQKASALYCTREEFSEAAGRLTAISKQLAEFVASESSNLETRLGLAPRTLEMLLQDLSDCRRYLMLAEAGVEVDEQGEVTVVAGIEPHQRLPNPKVFKELAPGAYTVSIVMPTFGAFVAVLAQDGGGKVYPLLEIQAPRSDDGIRKSTLRFVDRRKVVNDIILGLRDRFAAKGIEVIRSKITDQISADSYEEALRLYVIAATARVQKAERIQFARDALRKSGLKYLLGRNSTVVRLVAGMSMISNTDQVLGMDRKSLVAFARFYFLNDATEGELMDQLHALAEKDVDAVLLKLIDEKILIYI